MKDINLQEICKELHIYEFGIASWPLPEPVSYTHLRAHET